MQNVDRFLPVALFIVVFAVAAPAHAFSTGISSNSFGASGCNQCHFGGLAPTVTLTGPTTVAAGSTNVYSLQVSAVGTQNDAGLNVAATDGTLGVGGSDSSFTQTIAGKNGLMEITHTGAKPASGGFVVFSFQWTAPGTSGSVTMTGWGNAVNDNFNKSGDMAATASLVITVTGSVPTPTPTRAPGAQPPGADAKLNAPVYNVKLVKAMDECGSPTTIVGSVPACVAANSATDPGNFNLGKVIVKQLPKGKGSKIIYILKSSGASGDNKGDLHGRTVQLKLVLRITRAGSSYNSDPALNQQVTWEDVTLLCSPPLTMDPHGNGVGRTTLQACGLRSYLSSETNNKEIVSASIVDATTGKAIGVPGVVHK